MAAGSCYTSDINEDLTLLLVALFHPIRQGGPSGFSKSLQGALDWSKKHVGDNLCTTSFSQQYPSHQPSPISPHPTPSNPTEAGVWTFSNSLTPSSHKAIKLRNIPGKGTTNPLSQSIQWTGRVVRGICMQSFTPLASAWSKAKTLLCLNRKGYRVRTFPCCGVTGHGMHATVHVIFHSSSQSASLGV